MSSGPSVVVVGGGIAGLAAARRLARAGADVTVVEAEQRLGGKVRTSPFASRLVDEGADAFLLRVPWALDLCRDLGIDGELVHPAVRTAAVWGRGELHLLPPQLMGVPTDLRALGESGILSLDGLAAAAADLTAPATPLDGDEAIADALARRIGTEAVERMVEPLVGGINAGDVRKLSLAAVVPQLDAALRDPMHASLIESCRDQQQKAIAEGARSSKPIFASPAGGMGRLVEALAADLGGVAVRMGRRVDALEPAGADRAGHTVYLDDGTELDADAVVLAVPAHAAAPLLTDVAPGAATVMAGVEHASVAFATIAVRPGDVAVPLDHSGFLVPRVEHLTITACSWTSTKWAHLGPDRGDGTVVLRASVGRHGDDDAGELDDADLVARVLDDLGATMGLAGAPTEVRVTRWPRSFPQYEPGHLGRIADVERALPATVALAGASLRGVGVPACIHSGHDAADRVLAR